MPSWIDFAEIVEGVPEEQKEILDRMIALGLARSYAWSDTTHRYGIVWTPRGKEFLNLVKAVITTVPKQRLTSLTALDMLAAGEAAIGGYAPRKKK